MTHRPLTARRAPALLEEVRKIGAFMRRDLLILVSYRFAIVSDWLSLALQLAIFSIISRMVDPAAMPVIDGTRVTYLEFVTIGIAINALMQVGLGRVVAFVRREQLTGTLESLLMTPTALATVQLGSAVFHVLYVPLRTVVFLLLARPSWMVIL